ncbi:MAG: DUF4383 domain-containing protein [Actinomycetota bacterium]|nr:DUF4383 domain-containing protein [Actinomycetota bacterium]
MVGETITFSQYGVRLISVVYVALGLLGFLPFEALNPTHHNEIDARYLLHLVAINAPHNIFHLAIGVSGLWAARTTVGAHRWAIVVGVVLLALFFGGMLQAALQGFPSEQLLLGLIPLNSPGHVLHAVTGGIALYLGMTRS